MKKILFCTLILSLSGPLSCASDEEVRSEPPPPKSGQFLDSGSYKSGLGGTVALGALGFSLLFEEGKRSGPVVKNMLYGSCKVVSSAGDNLPCYQVEVELVDAQGNVLRKTWVRENAFSFANMPPPPQELFIRAQSHYYATQSDLFKIQRKKDVLLVLKIPAAGTPPSTTPAAPAAAANSTN